MVITSNQESVTNAPPPGQKIDAGASVPPQNPASQLTGRHVPAGAAVEAKKRKSVISNEIFASDVSLTESETTPDSVTSPGKKLKKEREDSSDSSEDFIITKRLRVKDESRKSSNPVQIKRAVRKVSHFRKLPTDLKDCHFKISTGKRSITCKRNWNGSVPDLEQDKVDNNGVDASERQNDVNSSNECSNDVPQPNTNASNTNRTADFAEENAVGILPHDRTKDHIADSEGQDSLTDGVAKIPEGQLVDLQLLNLRAILELSTGSQDKVSNPSLSRLVSSDDQVAPLPLSKNLVSTDLSPNSEFNQHNLAEQTLDNSVTPDIVLPFEMSSLWKLLQTTNEVFGRIPQRPHFKKLESGCKEKREGAAIGMVVTYAKLVDLIEGLSTHTELKVMEDKIECLDYLEENGFIVDPIRRRLHRLLEIKTNYSKFASKWIELETELAKEKQKDKDLLASAYVCKHKLADISKSITKLEVQLCIMKQQKEAVMEEGAGILDLAAEHKHNRSRIEDEMFRINRSKELASKEFGRVVAEPLQ